MQGTPIKILADAMGQTVQSEEIITGISTDSRTVEGGCIFVCIEGERFDGHRFAADALEKGTAFVVSHKPLPLPADRVFYVENTMDANILLSGGYRSQFSPQYAIGITGSVGKTTTKELIAAVLERRYKTLKTQGNENNEIGLPKTLLRLEESYGAMVLEMGMNAIGDVRKLCKAVRPGIGVLTSIGVSHLERLGSRENILKAKLELAEGLPDGAPLIIAADNDLLGEIKIPRLGLVRCGIDSENLDYRASDIVEEGLTTRFMVHYPGGKSACTLPTIGRHNVQNALLAFAVGIQCQIPVAEIVAGLFDYIPSGSRQNIVDWRGCRLVEDCYNASPDSVRAAMSTLSAMECKGRKLFVLGDMLELGAGERAAHREMGAYAAEQRIGHLYCVGELTKESVAAAGISASHYPDNRALAAALLAEVAPGDILWVKGSRGMHLEEVLGALYENDPNLHLK